MLTSQGSIICTLIPDFSGMAAYTGICVVRYTHEDVKMV